MEQELMLLAQGSDGDVRRLGVGMWYSVGVDVDEEEMAAVGKTRSRCAEG